MTNQWIFKGFETPLPLSFIIVLLIVSIALAFWSYASVNIKRSHKLILSSLRSIGFIFLVLVLLNPVIQRITKERLKSKIVVLFDNSLSTTISLGKYEGKTSFNQSVSFLSQIDTNYVELDYFGFDASVFQSNYDSISSTGRNTDIAKAISTISELKRDANAIILFSDGQFTTGQDPRFVVDRLSIPIFTVGLGDTVRNRDVYIQDVIHPDIAYKNSPFIVEVIVNHNGFMNSKSRLSLKLGTSTIESKDVEFQADRSVQSVRFEINPVNEGLQQFEVQIDPLPGEWTQLNNDRRFAVDVLDNKLRVLLISFEVHPDSKVLQQVLESDATITHRSITWLGSNRFLNGPIPANTDTLDVLLLYGYPHAGIPSNIRNQVNNLLSSSSYILAASPLFDPALAMSSLQNSIPLSLPSTNSPFEIGLRQNMTTKDHPILKFEHPDYTRAPRVYSHIRNISAIPGSEVLFKANFRGADLDAPVLIIRSIGSRRTSVLNMFGYYSWNLSTNPLVRNGIQDLLRNLIVWTSTKPDDRKLIINPLKREFDSIDPVILNAFLKDDSGIQVTDGIINLTVSDQDGQNTSYTLNNDGLGKYSLNLGELPQGLYSFDARAIRGTRELDRRTGQFTVSENVIEYQKTFRNEVLLKDLATVSDGLYLPWNESNQLKNVIHSADFRKEEYRDLAFDWYPYRRIAWFLLAISFFTAEWLLRKYFALP